jgi:hypothetical protein
LCKDYPRFAEAAYTVGSRFSPIMAFFGLISRHFTL